jgi:hypothetical protein
MIDITTPSFTRRVHSTDLSTVGVEYLFYGEDIEEDRAETIVEQLSGDAQIVLCKITVVDDAYCRIDGVNMSVNLYEASDLDELASRVNGLVAVDLTSLEHRVWAPLVKALLGNETHLVALYAEPDDYQKSFDLPGTVYDLSITRGIEPLPGFARLARRKDDSGDFAPLLGFEGARLGHMFDQEEVEERATAPIVGSPGFRPEYPTYTYLANRDVLEKGRMHSPVEYARASCPFEAYDALVRIHTRIGKRHLRVAPIGTKPHALGAVLFAIDHPSSVELIYDHPVRSKGRTRGSRGVYVYEVSGFVKWLAK